MGGYMASSTSILCLQIDLDILDNWPQLCRATISIKGSFQSRQTDGSGNIICEQDEKVMMSCMAQCRARLLKDLCNCTPTSWPTIAPLSFNGEECTLTRYRTCLKFNISDESSCTDECHRLPPCNRVDYGLTQKNFPDFIGKEAGDFIGKGMRVELIIDSLTYSMFTEKLRYTTSDFIADLGGALGFYVGIDFPFLIEASIS
uniref:Uncharacterized protein n=1 Tax=Plectus sambesii TaxID=2011161 RepID=A0A914XQ57_9BILA